MADGKKQICSVRVGGYRRLEKFMKSCGNGLLELET